jgi:hypothetical protein
VSVRIGPTRRRRRGCPPSFSFPGHSRPDASLVPPSHEVTHGDRGSDGKSARLWSWRSAVRVRSVTPRGRTRPQRSRQGRRPRRPHTPVILVRLRVLRRVRSPGRRSLRSIELARGTPSPGGSLTGSCSHRANFTHTRKGGTDNVHVLGSPAPAPARPPDGAGRPDAAFDAPARGRRRRRARRRVGAVPPGDHQAAGRRQRASVGPSRRSGPLPAAGDAWARRRFRQNGPPTGPGVAPSAHEVEHRGSLRCYGPASDPRSTDGSVSSVGSMTRWERTRAAMASFTSQTFTFMPDTTRPWSSQKTITSLFWRSPR